jgi:hypothetical protein
VLAFAFVISSPGLLGAQRFTCEAASTVLLSDDTAPRDRWYAGRGDPRRLLDEPVRPPFGTRLIRVEDRTRIVATIAEMGRQDPDEELRRLAAKVATELPRLIQESDDNDLFKRTWPYERGRPRNW